jgi:hypothetical protein
MVARLVNWSRWGRQDSGRPDPESVTGGIYNMGRADRQGEGESGEDAEAPDDPIDHRDADNLDGYIMRLRPDHKRSIVVYFYKRRPVHRPLVDEAILRRPINGLTRGCGDDTTGTYMDDHPRSRPHQRCGDCRADRAIAPGNIALPV